MKIETVAQRYHISTSAIRYYEQQGLIGPINRINGIRDFAAADLERMDFILCVKRCGMTIKQMKQFIATYEQGDSTLRERLAILQTQLSASEEQLTTLTRSINHLKQKIGDIRIRLAE
ncbi:MerR family transcriptional regulator [Levilactobacillus brevis]|uniref:MerR family transcriptional regulator n=1 Tax=Levilactobacillus brevis TaxID=1580 RepID=UPI0032E351DF